MTISAIDAANTAIRADIQTRVSRIRTRLEEIKKSEDFINLPKANDPDADRFKNIGGKGLDSLPKAGKAVGKDEGSGGEKKKGKSLGKNDLKEDHGPAANFATGVIAAVADQGMGALPKVDPNGGEKEKEKPKPEMNKDEMALGELCKACGGKKMVKNIMCKACGGKGTVKKSGAGNYPDAIGPEPSEGAGSMSMAEKMNKVAPPGREDQVKELKGKVKNPYAVAWASYDKTHKKGELEPQQTGGQMNTPPKVTEGIHTKGGTSPAYQHTGVPKHSTDKPAQVPVKKDEFFTKGGNSVPEAKPPGAGGSPRISATSKIPTPSKPKMHANVTPSVRIGMATTTMGMGKKEGVEQFNALRIVHLKKSGLSKEDLVAGAGHHLNGLNLAIIRKDEESAQKHAVLCTVYERLLGNDPTKGPSKEAESAATKLSKGEQPIGFRYFAKDTIAENLFKAILGLLPKTMALPTNAASKPLPGVKGPVPGKSMRTSGAAGSAPAISVKPPQTMDFNRPGGLPAPQGPQSSVKMASGPTGANPLMPKPNAAGSVLAGIRQKIFGSKTAASAPPSASKSG